MISSVLGLPFRAASALRGARIFHPDGVMFTGELSRIAEDGDGLPLRTCAVVARLSRGIGVPWGLPDVAGLAIRLPPSVDGEPPWDVLLASAGPGLIGRMLPWPATSFGSAQLTTLMPLKHDGHLWWLRAKISTPTLDRFDVHAATAAVEGDGITVQIEQSRGTAGFLPLAVLRSSAVLDLDDERFGFDPIVNTHPGVRPQPEWLRNLRSSAYRNSRAGRRS